MIERPIYPLRPTTLEERLRYGMLWVAFEHRRHPTLGRMWTQAQLDAAAGARVP